jgi:hypothetical protein
MENLETKHWKQQKRSRSESKTDNTAFYASFSWRQRAQDSLGSDAIEQTSG